MNSKYIEPYLTSQIKGTPHVLMELSTRSFKRFKNNSIVLDELTVQDGIVSYNNVTYGSNVCHMKTASSSFRINLNEMKQNYVMIVARKSEVTSHPYFNDTIILQHGLKYINSTTDESCNTNSGYVILMVAKMKKNI